MKISKLFVTAPIVRLVPLDIDNYNKDSKLREAHRLPFVLEINMENKQYCKSYVHICNGGYSFVSKVVENPESGSLEQWLDIELTSFGMPLITRIRLDENIIDALEYVIDNAKAQWNNNPSLKANYNPTSAPMDSRNKINQSLDLVQAGKSD